MGRWADAEDDSSRLPEGFKRTGYDADTQKYTFVDSKGRTYESAEGNRYGVLRPVGGSLAQEEERRLFADDDDDEEEEEDDEGEGEEEGGGNKSRKKERNRSRPTNTNAARTFDDMGSQYRDIDRDIDVHNAALKAGNREAVRTMLPFALLVLVVLLLIFRFLYSSSSGSSNSGTDERTSQVHCAQGHRALQVEEGTSCWEIAQGGGLGVEEFLELQGNERVNCQRLRVGGWVCVPE